MGAGDFQAAESLLGNEFVVQHLLPFALVFAIVYGVLDSVDIFGNDSNMESVVAAAIGIFVAFQGNVVYTFMQTYLPDIGLLLVGLLGVVIVLGISGLELEGSDGLTYGGYLVIGIGLLFMWSSFGDTQFLEPVTGQIGSAGNLGSYVVVIGILYLIYKGMD